MLHQTFLLSSNKINFKTISLASRSEFVVAGDRLFSDFEDCQEEMVVSGLSHFTAVEFLKSASAYSNHYGL